MNNKMPQAVSQIMQAESLDMYEISLKENLSNAWQNFFGGLELESKCQSRRKISVLKGELKRSALEGLLYQLRDLNLHVESVHSLETHPNR